MIHVAMASRLLQPEIFVLMVLVFWKGSLGVYDEPS